MDTVMKTRNQWLQQLRHVHRGEEPCGWLTITIPGVIRHELRNTDGSVEHWSTEDIRTRRVPLYAYQQTAAFQRLCPTVLRALYTSYFVTGRTKYIWRCNDDWVTCKGYLDNDKIKAHIEGREIYGVRAGDLTNCLVIDLDLHGGCKEVVVRQLHVIVGHFHGTRRVHYSLSRRGVHVIIILDRPTPLDAARAWL